MGGKGITIGDDLFVCFKSMLLELNKVIQFVFVLICAFLSETAQKIHNCPSPRHRS
jgi:hypothetical protein